MLTMKVATVGGTALGVFLAALAAGAAQAAPTGSTAPVVVHPLPKGKEPPPDATVDIPMDDRAIGTFASVWPRGAYQARIRGEVMLICDVDRHGLAERCDVGSESPPGKGFGEAALELRPTFKLTPAHDASGPIESKMRIAIEFKPPDPQFLIIGAKSGPVGDCGGAGKPCAEWHVFGNPLNRHDITMVDNPVWAAAPTFADLAQAYPAKAGGMEGYAVVHCELMSTGALEGCQITKEAPEHRRFGEAAVALARKFKVAPEIAAARPHDDLWVDVAIRFPPPGEAPDRSVAAPRWVAGFVSRPGAGGLSAGSRREGRRQRPRRRPLRRRAGRGLDRVHARGRRSGRARLFRGRGEAGGHHADEPVDRRRLAGRRRGGRRRDPPQPEAAGVLKRKGPRHDCRGPV